MDLKCASHDSADPICSIFSLLFLKRRVLHYIKVSNIQLILKNNKPTTPTYCRPISLTRVFERLLYDKSVSHTYNSFISKIIFGFRNGSSTCCALIRILNDIFGFKHQSDYCRVVSLDMTKAFDTVFKKAIFDGIAVFSPPLNECVIDVFTNFLTVRIHYTTGDGNNSGTAGTNMGVLLARFSLPFLLLPSPFLCTFTVVQVKDKRLAAYAEDTTHVIGGTYTNGNNEISLIAAQENHLVS